MSEKHKATLKKANAAISARDHEGFLVHCTEDIEWTMVGDLRLKGKEAVRRWMKTAYAEPPRFKQVQAIAEGNMLVVTGQIMVRDERGKEAPHAYCDVWRFRRGKMAGLMAYVVKTKVNPKRGRGSA